VLRTCWLPTRSAPVPRFALMLPALAPPRFALMLRYWRRYGCRPRLAQASHYSRDYPRWAAWRAWFCRALFWRDCMNRRELFHRTCLQ